MKGNQFILTTEDAASEVETELPLTRFVVLDVQLMKTRKTRCRHHGIITTHEYCWVVSGPSLLGDPVVTTISQDAFLEEMFLGYWKQVGAAT